MKTLICVAAIAGMMAWTARPADSIKMPPAPKGDTEYEQGIADAKRIMAAYNCSPDIPNLASRAALDNHLSSAIVAAVIVVESSCNKNAVSAAGAKGLMQLNTDVHKVDMDKVFDPAHNIAAGTRVLGEYTRKYGTRGGLRHFYGITEGSDASDKYADKVMTVANGY